MSHRHRAYPSLSATLPWIVVVTVLATPLAPQRDRQPWGEAAALATTHSISAMAVAQAAPEPSASPSPDPTIMTTLSRDVAWWPWILAFPGLGGLLWWILRATTPKPEGEALKFQSPSEAVTEKILGSGATDSATNSFTDTETDISISQATPVKAERRIILVPRSSHGAYAYWELPDAEVEALKQRQCSLALKVHDVTDIAQVDQQPPHATELWDCPTQATGDLHLTLAQENREYLLELGYRDESDTWHALVRSAAVRSPASHPVTSDAVDSVDPAASDIPDPLAANPAAAEPPAASPDPPPSFAPRPTAQATLTPQTCRSAQAHWELSPEQIAILTTGNHRLMVHLYDVTELPGGFSAGPNSMQTFEVDSAPQAEQVLPIAVDDRDYLIEVGYVTENGQWQVLAKSSPVRVPACSP